MANGIDGNGSTFFKWPAVMRIVEAFIIAGVTGLVAMYGANAKVEATVSHLCESIKEIKTDVKDLRIRIDIIGDRQIYESRMNGKGGK